MRILVVEALMKLPSKVQTKVGMLYARSALFLRDEAGQDLIEYALVACLIALSAVASMKSIGSKVAASFLGISTTVTNSI
jgi:Flp pilus assembly pilin Flp